MHYTFMCFMHRKSSAFMVYCFHQSAEATNRELENKIFRKARIQLIISKRGDPSAKNKSRPVSAAISR